MQARKTRAEQTSIYREWKNVKKALLCHIHTDIYDNYIEHLVDGDTSLIEEDIPTVHENLFF